MALPKRKPNRLPNYDYSSNGAYFITICVQDRKHLLCDIVGDDALIVPKPYGLIAEKYIANIPQVEKYVIMPNHIHMLILLQHGPMKASAPTTSVSDIVRSFKIMVTKEIGKPIFQRSFHDHIVRTEQDYLKIWEYIDSNPAMWETDCFYPKEAPVM